MKDIEIGEFCGISLYIKPEELMQMAANKELHDHTNRIIEENNILVYRLGLTIEALNKILKRTKEVKNKDGLSEYARRVCQNVLKEVEQ